MISDKEKHRKALDRERLARSEVRTLRYKLCAVLKNHGYSHDEISKISGIAKSRIPVFLRGATFESIKTTHWIDLLHE